VLGAAPGSRETALLAPEKTIERVHALVLAGGSAFGLDAACGVVRYLEERGEGLATPFGVVPIVPAAVLFDLSVGDPRARPDAAAGYAAARGRQPSDPVRRAPWAPGRRHRRQVRRLRGAQRSGDRQRRGACGARRRRAGVSNAVGDVVDPGHGALVAGMRLGRDPERRRRCSRPAPGAHTTLVVVVTDAPLTKAEAHALATAAHVGIARVTRPSHTVHDGDTPSSAASAAARRGLGALGVAVQAVVARALLRGTRAGLAAE
jgi:L-aminopeptidase/D-esterase-like protein